jgi:hypothetical protein
MRMCLPVICDTKCARHLRVMCLFIGIPKYIHKYLDSYLGSHPASLAALLVAWVEKVVEEHVLWGNYLARLSGDRGIEGSTSS